MKKKLAPDSRIKTKQNTVIKCLVCGAVSKDYGDRWNEFMHPHIKRHPGKFVNNLFEWLPTNLTTESR